MIIGLGSSPDQSRQINHLLTGRSFGEGQHGVDLTEYVTLGPRTAPQRHPIRRRATKGEAARRISQENRTARCPQARRVFNRVNPTSASPKPRADSSKVLPASE